MKHVGLIGAGAVGAYFIWAMQQVYDIDFFLIADEEHREKLKDGISINYKTYTTEVKTPEEVTDLDLVLVATKYSGLDSAIACLKKATKPDTIILSLLNGVDSEQRIKEAGVQGTVLYSVMRIASRRTDEGIFFLPAMTQGVFFGAMNEAEQSAVDFVASTFAETKVRYTIHDNILDDLWLKYASNIANNLPQAVLGTDASLYVDSEHGYFLAKKLWNEVYQVATAKGIHLPTEPLIFTSVPKSSKYSTLQDLNAKRHTEIDMFAGQMMQMAGEFGIEVPYITYTYHAIKALEEKNDHVIGC